MTGTEALTTCPICFESIERWRDKKVGETTYAIDRCRGCNFAFVNPRPSLEFLMNFYSTSGHSTGDPSYSAPSSAEDVLRAEEDFPNSVLDAERIISRLSDALRERPQSPRFLDVGCGYGFFSRRAKEAGFEVSAIELAQSEREITRQVAGIEAAGEPFETYSVSPFDTILMSQILEHARDPVAWISKAHSLLKAGGVIAIAVPNFGSALRMILQEREPYICPPAHLNFFSEKSLRALLILSKFEMIGAEWVSRIPRSAFERRLPGALRRLVPVMDLACKTILEGSNRVGLGQLVTVYARKLG